MTGTTYNIKRKGWIWNLVPLTGRNRFSCTFGNTIYLTPSRYDDYKSGNPKGSTIALIEHEKVHVDQHRRDPNFKKNYITSRAWRLEYEAEAYGRQARTRVRLDKRGRDRPFFVDRYTKLLSSTTYLLFMSYETVYQAIDIAYDKS